MNILIVVVNFLRRVIKKDPRREIRRDRGET